MSSVRYRKKIFMVHFRNIIGNRQEFSEVGPDEGVVDFVRAMRIYKEVGYCGMICPDHAVQARTIPGELSTRLMFMDISAL